MRLRTVLLSTTASLFLLGACGSPPKYNLPVDSSLKPFKAPTEDELTAQDVDLTQPMDDDEEEFEDPMDSMGDDDDDSGADESTDAAAPKADAAKPAADAAKKPAPKKGR